MDTAVTSERAGRPVNPAGSANPANLANPWLVLAVLCAGQCVALMDTTIVNVAIPALGTELGASIDQILWVINGYLLAYAALTATGGRLGDVFGPRRLYLIGLMVFALASAACAVAADPGQLIAARVVQGIGGALLTPQALPIINRVFPPDRRGAALGVWGSAAGVAAACGPTLGGVLVETAGWRWVFAVNVVIVAVVAPLAAKVVPDLRGDVRPRMDVAGTVLLTCALSMVVYAFVEGPSHHWGALIGPVSAPVLIGAAAGVLAMFAIVERRRQDAGPLLPFAVLRDRDFTVVCLVIGVLPASLGAVIFLTTIHLQCVLGMTPAHAGLTLALAPLVSVFVAPPAGRWTDRAGGRRVLISGLLLFAAGITALALGENTADGWPALIPGLLTIGLAMGVVFSPAAAVAMRGTDISMAGSASGLFNLARLGGGVLGSAAVGALFQSRLAGSVSAAPRPQLAHALHVAYLLPVALLTSAAVAVVVGVRRRG
jgi:EmrB/QacA subfamily drug resistance transporter